MDKELLGKCGYYCGQCPSFWTKSALDVSKGMRVGYAMQETVRYKKNSYPVGTVKISRATKSKPIPKQRFSAPYG